jgi:hypothetical protein
VTTAAIDLGGTSLRVGYLGPDGFTVVPSADGTGAVPAAVWLAAPGDARPGELAAAGPAGEVITTVRADLLADPRASARERYFHDRYESPVAVAGYLLRDAARRASLAAGSEVTDVILGRRATVDDSAAVRRAAAAAGLTVADIIAEPVAVALHYGAVCDGVDHDAVVADLGATTMDVTVLRITGRVVTIAAAATRPAPQSAAAAAALTELIRQTIGQVTTGSAGPPDTVLLAGGAGQAPAVAEALAGLGLHVRASQPGSAVVRGLGLSASFGPLYVTGLGGGALTPPAPPPPRMVPSPAPASAAAPPVTDPLPRQANPGPAGRPAAAAADPLPRAAAAEPTRAAAADPPRPAPDKTTTARPVVPPPAPPPPRAARPQAAAHDDDAGTAGTPRAPGEVPVDGASAAGKPAGRPVDGLRALRRGDRLLLTWEWPAGSAEAQVRWRSDRDGSGQHGAARCTRRLFNHEGGFEIPTGRDGVMVTVEALGYGTEFDNSPPSALRVEPAPPAVTYDPDVQGWRKWTATLTFTSQVDCRLPSVFAVLGTGAYKPESTRDGTVVHVIPAQPLSAGQPTVVTFELAARRGTCWLVCLPSDDDTVAAVDLRPAALHRLRVRR